jgi:hypothetical protein
VATSDENSMCSDRFVRQYLTSGGQSRLQDTATASIQVGGERRGSLHLVMREEKEHGS